LADKKLLRPHGSRSVTCSRAITVYGASGLGATAARIHTHRNQKYLSRSHARQNRCQLRTLLSKSKSKIFTSTKPAKICGAAASVSSVRLGSGKNPAIIETTVLSQHGLTYAKLYGFGLTYSFAAAQGQFGTYLLLYLHPSNYTDEGAQQSLRTLCGGLPLPPSSRQ